MSDSLNRSVKAGVVWVAAERGALQALHLLGTVVLARLLTPADFGVIALATLPTGLATRLVQFGFGMALIQRDTIRPDHVSTMFVITLVINGLLTLLFVLAAPYIGAYFDNPLVGDVLMVMSSTFLIRCVAVCPSALLRRAMNFQAMAVSSVLDAAVKIVLATFLAFQNFGVWSLVYGELAGAVTQKVYLILVSGWRPSISVTRAAVSDLFGFGLGISAKSTLIYLTDRADNFVVGKWLGTASLGLYEKAYNLMDLPVKELSDRMKAVLFPAFSRIHQDQGRLRAAYRKTALSSSVLCLPIFGTLGILAPQIIQVVYGAQWGGTVVPFQILCLAGLPRILTQITGSVINATGSVRQEVVQRSLMLILLVVGAIGGIRWGIVGVAVAVTLVNLVTFALIVLLLRRVSTITLGDVVGPQVVPLAATVVLLGVEKGLQVFAVQTVGLHPVAALVWSSGIGVLAYLTALYLMRGAALTALLEELRADFQLVLGRLSPGLVNRAR